MKKETINTFGKGLVSDFNPITTPKDVLTDALNATLITYNGNEGMLQNDMGNTQVGTAYLPAGYVPVGMKEHGGIVYVAAWNPETKKGQIGSYPSPQQLWEDSDWTVSSSGATILSVVFNQTDFYNDDYIHTEIVRKELFRYNDNTTKELHPGDRYAITVDPSINSILKSYASQDYLSVQLSVVKKDGSIEIMEDSNDGDWFLLDNNISASQLIQTNKCKVFRGSSSGKLLIIVTIKTLDSFDIIRDYSLSGNNIIVTFTGKGTKAEKTYSSLSDSYLKLYMQGGSRRQSSTTISGSSGTKNYIIYPDIPQGIVQRMKRAGTINFDKIKKSQDDFHEWRYFVADEYIKIGWAYEFYNLDKSKQIEYIEVAFYDYEKPSTYNPGGAGDSPVDIIQLTKDYYSGNFEEILRKDVHPNLREGRIYIVEFRKKIMGETNPTIIADKMMYLSTFYNSKYNGIYDGITDDQDLSDIVEFTDPNTGQDAIHPMASISFDSEFTYSKSNETQAAIKNPSSTSWQEKGNLGNINASDYLTEVDHIAGDHSNIQERQYSYTTELTNTYTAEGEATPKIDIPEGIIGQVGSNILQTICRGFRVKDMSIDTIGDWVNSTQLAIFSGADIRHSGSEIGTTPQISWNAEKQAIEIKNITIKDYKYIQGLSSQVKKEPYQIKGLTPVYSNSMGIERKRRTFSGYNRELPIVISVSKKGVCYNSTLQSSGTVIDGTDTGAGNSNEALQAAAKNMNETSIPDVNILAGTDGQDASLRVLGTLFGPTVKRVKNFGGWIFDNNNEVTGQDGFLIAAWKFDTGNVGMINLFSTKDWKAEAALSYPRLDVMLKCFMSQVFIVQNVTKTGKYITTNDKFYRYQEGLSQFSLILENNSSSEPQDIMYPSEEADSNLRNTTLYNIFASAWRNKTSTGYGANKMSEVVNLVPKVGCTFENQIVIENEIDEEFGINDVLTYYLGLKLTEVSTMEDEASVGDIYIVDSSYSSENAIACGSTTGRPKPKPDGTFVWKSKPKLKKLQDVNVSQTFVSNNKDSYVGETLYSWTGQADWKMKVPLKAMFTTKATAEGWDDISEGEENELLVNSEFADSRYVNTKWVENGDEDAFHFYYGILASNKSLYTVNTI